MEQGRHSRELPRAARKKNKVENKIPPPTVALMTEANGLVYPYNLQDLGTRKRG